MCFPSLAGEKIKRWESFTTLDKKMVNPKTEHRKATDIAYIEHTGPYDKIPWEEYIERLYGWAKEQKVMPGFYPLGIYLDDPKETPSEKCRSEIAITYKGSGNPHNKVEVKKMESMEVATISHKGPGAEFKKTYAQLMEWIVKKGYTVSGPSIEVYTKKPEVVDGITILYAKIMMPVKK
jgi:AraC family transcriptional regulator